MERDEASPDSPRAIPGSRASGSLLTPRATPVSGMRIAEYLVRKRSRAERYGVSIVATLMASVATVALGAHLGRAVFVLLWPAVLLSAIVGGLGPATISSVVGVLVVDAWLLPPGDVGRLAPADLPAIGIFVFASLTLSAIADALLASRARNAEITAELQRVAEQLEAQAIEMEQQLAESQAMREELEQTTDELALRTREAQSAGRFSQGIVESIADPFVVHDADWRFVFLTDRARAIFRDNGRGDSGSLLGQRLWDVYPEIIGTEHERQMRRAATERVPVTYEAFYEPGASWAVMSCFPLPDGGLATQWRDITIRRRAEENARYLARASEVLGESLEYETTLTDLAHLVVPELAEWCTVHIVNAEGEVEQVALAHAEAERVAWAAELNRRYPAKPEAAQGTHAVIRSGEPLLLADITDDHLVAGTHDAEHLRLVRNLGLRSAMIVPIAAHGRVFGALGLFSGRGGRRYGVPDLELATELARRAALAVDNAMRHRAERDARRAADEANGAKMQFLTVMSHELRTPLNAIGGYTELMQLGLRGPLTDAQHTDLSRIATSQRSLLGLINDILNFAKVEAGHVDISLEAVPVSPLVREVEDIVRPRLLSGALEFVIEGDAEVGVMADREKLRQILVNLLTNAIKFTAPKGTITVRCGRQGTSGRIDVGDTGIGIEPGRLDAVFDPFVQLGRTLSSVHEGTGLGLAISRDLARAMHGDITASSVLGRGSVFSVVLPLSPVVP